MTIKRWALASLLTAIGFTPAYPQTTGPRAKAADVHGRAEWRSGPDNAGAWAPLKTGDLIDSRSAIRTAPDSAVLLVLPGDHVLRIGEKTLFNLKEIGQDSSFSFAVLRGRIWSFVDKATRPAKYEVETPSTILGVSGTLFSVAHDGPNTETDVSVENGEVRLRQGQASQNVRAGFQLRVPRDQLDRAVPQKHTKATREMWKAIHTENWSKPNGSPRLNQQVEEKTRAVQQERRSERRQEGQRTSRGAGAGAGGAGGGRGHPRGRGGK